MNDMGWSAALTLTAAGIGLAFIVVLFLCDYFGVNKSEIRAIRRVRRKRRNAFAFLRSTSRRDCYSEFDGARR